MIPHKITLHNFLSYGPTNESLDFRQFDLACLSGPNGAGKSSLLEAIIWALWGKGRSSDDQLIFQGEKEMWVEFEFSCGGQNYKVIRKRIKNRSLFLELFVEKEGVFFPISEATNTKTQEKLSKILKISHEAFLNSAFLRQGKADEFTKKTPAERKAILGEILGLGFYDEIAIKAKEKIKEREILLGGEKIWMEKIQEEIKNEPEYQKKLENTKKELKKLKEKLQKEEESFLFWNKKAIILEQKEKEKENLLREKEGLVLEIEESKKEKEILEAEIKKLEEIRLKEKEIRSSYMLLERLKKEEKVLSEKLSLYSNLLKEKHRLSQAIVQERHQLEMEKNSLLQSLSQILKKLKEKEVLEKQQKMLLKELEEKEKLQKQLQKLKEEKKVLEEKELEQKIFLSQLKKEGEDVKNKIDLIVKTKAHCPLCEKPLSAQEKQKLSQKFQKELEDLRQKYSQALENFLKNIQKNKEKIEKKIAEIEELIEKFSLKEKELAFLSLKIKEIEKEQAEKKTIEEKITLLEAKLKNKSYAADLFKKLLAVEKEIKNLAYDSKAHDQIKKKIESLAVYEEMKKKLEEADFKIEKNKEKIATLNKNIFKTERKKEEIEKKMATLENQLKDKEKVFSQQEAQKNIVLQLKEEVENYLSQQAFLETALKEIEKNKKELKEKEIKIKKLEEEKNIYKEIVDIVGKNGIQAMIIKNALPQIEEEAQRILSQLTQGKMKIFLRTEKEKKSSKEIKETLDIIIEDEKGERDYSMFSGGEAFRIDFAIRVALSKFLAQQSGFKLQMLVVDEGFGTQDSEGLSALVEVINTIKNDFKKILVVSHLEELKYHFPTKINIFKDQEGSHIAIEGI